MWPNWPPLKCANSVATSFKLRCRAIGIIFAESIALITLSRLGIIFAESIALITLPLESAAQKKGAVAKPQKR